MELSLQVIILAVINDRGLSIHRVHRMMHEVYNLSPEFFNDRPRAHRYTTQNVLVHVTVPLPIIPRNIKHHSDDVECDGS